MSESNGDGGIVAGFVLLCILCVVSLVGIIIITYGQNQPVESTPFRFRAHTHIGIEDLELGNYTLTAWEFRGPREEHPYEEHEYYIWVKDWNNTCYALGLDELPQNCSSTQNLLGAKIIKTETGIAKAT